MDLTTSMLPSTVSVHTLSAAVQLRNVWYALCWNRLPNCANTKQTDKGFQRLALLEEEKALPWNAVWDMFCLKNNVPVGEEFIAEVEKYEAEVTSKR